MIMLKILQDFDPCGRKMYAFDSFQGLPDLHPKDRNGSLVEGKPGEYAASEQTFISNLKRFKVYDNKTVVISKGWFNETCPISPVQKIAFLRMDGDLYASTMDVLQGLYHRVSPGGFVYVDDYGSYTGCQRAIDEFRALNNITEEIHYVAERENKKKYYYEAAWWRKRLFDVAIPALLKTG